MAPVLFVLFIVVPLVELAVIIQVGRVIGTGPTILALVAVSLAGAFLVRREGLRAWARFRQTLAAGRMPAEAVIDGALVLLSGALMLTPGFVTDAVGLLLVIPLSRRLVNRTIRHRARAMVGLGPRRPRGGGRPRAVRADDTIDVDAVRVEREQPADERDRHGPTGEPGGGPRSR